MTLRLVILADALAADRGDANQRLLWAGLLFIAVLLLGAVALSWLDRWRKRMTNHDAATGVDQLTAFRLSYERGELSDDEYRRIKARFTTAPPNEPSAETSARAGERTD